MLEEMSQSRLFSAFQATALMLSTTVCAAQGLAGPRHPISEADIAKELSAIGISVNVSQIHLPAHMSALVESPKLEIVSAKPAGNNQIGLELRCSAAAECLPFFATLDDEKASALDAEIRAKRALATALGRQMTSRGSLGPMRETHLRVGSHAVLTIRDGHMEIHLQVLAIDSGAVGQQVRVCTLDRRKVMHATVTGEGTVTGVIE